MDQRQRVNWQKRRLVSALPYCEFDILISVAFLANSRSILFFAATIISGLDAYRFWKSDKVRTKPDVYGRTASRSSSPETKGGDWSASTDDLEGAKYAPDAYHGWAADPEFICVESDTTEGRHPGRHVRIESTRTLDYENTSSAMSPTTTEGRYTGIFPPTPASYTFSKE